MIEGGETGDKEGKVGRVVVLHAEVIHHQDESDRAGGVAEKTRGVGLVEVKGLEKRDKTEREERQDGDLTAYLPL